MDKPPFVYVTYIQTSPERLWEALTDGAFTQRYWGGRRIQSNWNVGSPVRHVREDGGIDWQGEVLQSERPRLLSYTFGMQISERHRGEKPSRVTFELQPMGSVVQPEARSQLWMWVVILTLVAAVAGVAVGLVLGGG